jgi:hypothetical protein
MNFAGVNYLAVLVAAVLAFGFGAAYYGVLSKPWMKASKVNPENAQPLAPLLVTSFVCELVMAFVLAALIAGLGVAGLGSGIVTGFLVWLGFMATTTTINQRYEGYGWDLSIIDSGHWLGVAVIMGAVIGWWA